MRLWSWAWAHVLALRFQVLLPEGMDKKRGAEEERFMGDTVGLSPGQNQPSAVHRAQRDTKAAG